MSTLLTETNTNEIRERNSQEAEQAIGDEHKRNDVHFEHGQHWVTCLDCGAQWSVCDVSDEADGDALFTFEMVSDGDESCALEIN